MHDRLVIKIQHSLAQRLKTNNQPPVGEPNRTMGGEQIACPVCDCLFLLPPLQVAGTLHCPRCAERVSTNHAYGLDHALALATAALALLLCATWYPFLGFASSGQEATMTLLDSATSLFAYDQTVLGGVVFVLMFAGPLSLLLVLIALLSLLHLRVLPQCLPGLASSVQFLQHWNMVEVFLIGALVSIAKISSMASVQLGWAFWCFIGFTLCTIASLALVDSIQLWRIIRYRLAVQQPATSAAPAAGIDD